MFLECKAKRLRLDSKTTLNLSISESVLKDLKTLAEGIRKLYTSYLDFTQNEYPQIKNNSSKEVHLAVVTLEDWYIYLNPLIAEKLKELVQQAFIEKKMDINLIEQLPYTIFSGLPEQLHAGMAPGLYFHPVSYNSE